MSEQITKGVTMIALPSSNLRFIENNPKLANTLGKLMIIYGEAKKEFDSIVSDMRKTSHYTPLIENGTTEELEDLLNNLFAQDTKIFSETNLSDEAIKAVNEEIDKSGINFTRTNLSIG